MEVNTTHPAYCHVRCVMKPSMKEGLYHVYLDEKESWPLFALLLVNALQGNSFPGVCVCVCVCVHAYVRAYMCVCKCVLVCLYVCACVPACVGVFVCTYACVCMCSVCIIYISVPFSPTESQQVALMCLLFFMHLPVLIPRHSISSPIYIQQGLLMVMKFLLLRCHVCGRLQGNAEYNTYV